jgi:predicted transposase/invertase (TIGR01784 family)
MELGIKPTVDYAFKKVFGTEANVPVLMDLLDAVLKPLPAQRIAALEISNPFSDKDALDDKLSILDIKARDQSGRQYNIEMQMLAPQVYPRRVLYYWSVLYSQQLKEGDDYALLKPTISISFVNSVLFPQVADYHLAFQPRCSGHPELIFSEHMSVHLVELPKFHLGPEELNEPLDVWCYFLVHGAHLDPDNLPAALRRPPVQRAMEVLRMLTQSDLERERYQARLKAERDRVMLTEGIRAETWEQALGQGLEQGQLLGRIHLCQHLLKLPLTPSAELLSLPLSELQTRAAALEGQLEKR